MDQQPRINQTPPPANILPIAADIDHERLTNSLSSLTLNNHHHAFHLPPTLGHEYGGVSPPITGEGFITPLEEESFRVSNRVHNNHHHQVYNYSGVGQSTPRTVDPVLLQHHYNNNSIHPAYLLLNNKQFLHPGFRFDPRFDFDQRSYLLSKEQLYSTQNPNAYVNRCSSNPYAAISEGSFSNKQNLFMFRSSNLDLNRNKLLNHSFLSNTPLKELRGMICILAKDQNGCKILKSKFETPTEDEIEMVFCEVVGSIADLMMDAFGNYLIQKLVSVCNEEQKAFIIRELIEPPVDIFLVCMNHYGAKAIQKLLENLRFRNQIMVIMRVLERGAVILANDLHGHHVLQYCFRHFDDDINKSILKQLADNCYKVATDKSGCCVVQACVEHSRGPIRNRIVADIMNNAVHIAEDPYGNYVLQHIIGLKSPELTEILVRQLQGNFASLSQNKYASNVVEKCLTESGPHISERIVLELVRSPNPSSLLVDPYGNFVIQSALKVSKGIALESLRKLISRNLTSMETNLYGKKILERLHEKRRTQI